MLIRGTQVPCPHCKGRTKVIETGWSVKHKAYARRRQCDDCMRQFYTSEVAIPDTLFRPAKPQKVYRRE